MQIDKCGCCFRKYVVQNEFQEWFCNYCESTCNRNHTNSTSIEFAYSCVYDVECTANISTLLNCNICPCCSKMYTVVNDLGLWFCHYCDDANKTSWKCNKIHTAPQAHVVKQRRLAEKKNLLQIPLINSNLTK
jgi:hypothetical protein